MCGYVIRTKLNMDKFRSLFGAAILALASLPVNAALIDVNDCATYGYDCYTDRGQWEKAVFELFVKEEFGTPQSNADSITFDGGIVSAASSSTSGVRNEVREWDGTTPASKMYAGKVGNGSSGSLTITWNFPEPALGPIFGFFGDFYEVNSLSAGVGSDQFDIPSNNNGKGLTTFGMLSTVSFSQVVWRLGSGANNDTFLIDNFSYTATDPSAVPVPPALWLFGTGLLGLIGFSRRNKVA